MLTFVNDHVFPLDLAENIFVSDDILVCGGQHIELAVLD